MYWQMFISYIRITRYCFHYYNDCCIHLFHMDTNLIHE